MSDTDALICFADLLIDGTLSFTDLRLPSMLPAESAIRPIVGLRFAAASRICCALSTTLLRTGRVVSFWAVGVNALLMTWTRLSIRLAVARIPVRKMTAVSAQRMTMASMIPGRAGDVKRRISCLLPVALERRQRAKRRRPQVSREARVGAARRYPPTTLMY